MKLSNRLSFVRLNQFLENLIEVETIPFQSPKFQATMSNRVINLKRLNSHQTIRLSVTDVFLGLGYLELKIIFTNRFENCVVFLANKKANDFVHEIGRLVSGKESGKCTLFWYVLSEMFKIHDAEFCKIAAVFCAGSRLGFLDLCRIHDREIQ